MPLQNYCVLKGRPIDRRLASAGNKHYQIHVIDDDTHYRVAVNVESGDGSQVWYLVDTHFQHPVTAELAALPPGRHGVASAPGGAALDFIRYNLFDPRTMRPLPFQSPGPDNDLNDKIDALVQQAMADEDAQIYAIGEAWGPEANKADKFFGFKPGNGVHDIHMNQGNSGQWRKDNGVWQDGALLMEFPKAAHGAPQWAAIFMKFENQPWHTDDAIGHPIEAPAGGPPSDEEPAPSPFAPGGLPSGPNPDGLVRIVAALANSIESPERETVTLLNRSGQALSLQGWKLADKMKNKMALSGDIAAGGTLTIEVKAPMALSNKGGIITLLNPDGLRVDGVSYTRDQARNPGWSIKF